MDIRIQVLLDLVGQAERTAEKLVAPDGELKQHRHAVQQLSSQALQTHASLDALSKEQSTLDQLVSSCGRPRRRSTGRRITRPN